MTHATDLDTMSSAVFTIPRILLLNDGILSQEESEEQLFLTALKRLAVSERVLI